MDQEEMNAFDRFMVMLEWMLALEKRHADALQPGLVHIKYDASEIRDLTFGASDAATKLNEIQTCLQQVFRTTDLITRDGHSFWILSPFTQIDPIMEKVQQVIHTAPQNGLVVAHSNVRVYLLKDHMHSAAANFKNGRDYLDYLAALPPAVLGN
jgi:hypothetical protein